MPKIFVVEDDENIRELVVYALNSGGFEAVGFETGAAFFHVLESPEYPDILLLDIMLPEYDGLSILKKLRDDPRYRTLPIIMLTAKSSEFDKVKGLDMGADDYITKPFGVMELVSRVNAVLRRSAPYQNNNKKLEYGNILLDPKKRIVLVNGETIALTFKEYELLRYMLLNAGIVLSREKMIESIWGYEFEGESRTVDMHIKTLRQKLGSAGESIKTIRNVGYKMGE